MNIFPKHTHVSNSCKTPSVGRLKIMVMSPAGLGKKNDCVGETNRNLSHLPTSKWFWFQRKFGHESIRNPKPRTTVQTKESRNLIETENQSQSRDLFGDMMQKNMVVGSKGPTPRNTVLAKTNNS